LNDKVAVVRLEAVHEAVTSEVAARRRSGSYRAIGRRNLTELDVLPSTDASGVCAANRLVRKKRRSS